MSARRVAITGGSGFIGTNLIEDLQRDSIVLSLDKNPPQNPAHSRFWKQCDILDRGRLECDLAEFGPDHVLHFGARTDLHGRALTDYEANTRGVENVIAAIGALKNKPRAIYASSRLVFAIDHNPAHELDYLPSTVYGESKIEGENLVRTMASQTGIWTIVRPTSIWGPWFGTPYRDFFDSVARRRYARVRGVDPVKSFGYVGNSVYQVRRIMESEPDAVHQRTFWLSDYPPIDVNRWADQIARTLGIRNPRTLPYFLLHAAARIGDLAKNVGAVPQPPITSFRLRNLLTNMVYDTSSTERLVGPLPFTMEDGVAATVAWTLRK